jgi:hypothetical protein
MAQMNFAVVVYTIKGEFKMTFIEENAFEEHGAQHFLSPDAEEIDDAGVIAIIGDHDEQLPAVFTSQ